MRRIKTMCKALVVAGVALTALAGIAAESGGWRAARGALPTQDRAGQATVRAETPGGGAQLLVYRFPTPDVRALADGTLDVRTSSLESTGEPGEPVLPTLTARVAIPQGESVVSLKVVPGERHVVDLAAPVRHGQQPYPLSKPSERRATPRKESLYGSNDLFPSDSVRSRGVQAKRGVEFVDLVLQPVAYQPKAGKLVWFGTLTVEVVTQPATKAAKAARATLTDRARYRSSDDGAVVAMLVDNPVALGSYAVEPVAPTGTFAPPAGIQPLAIQGEPLPCRPAQSYKHVIITSRLLRDSFFPQRFQTIVALREAQGLTSTIITVEDIKNAYAAPDAAASVRAFIRDAYNKWETDFVLLGGDTNQVPMRALYATASYYQDKLPSDLYFQCLDGSFNSDGDVLWGEPTDGRDRLDGRPGEDIDLYAEVAVGRVPVESGMELMNWVIKQVQYETDMRAGTAPYLRGALMVGEYLGFGGVSDYATGMTEQIRLGSDADGYRTAGFKSLSIHDPVDTLYDSPGYAWTGPELADAVNTGQYSLLNHLGHCNTTICMKLPMAESDLRYANSNPAFLYTQGCYPGAFDADCIAEHMLSSTTFGFFGGVFNSRYGWGSGDSTDGPSQRYNRWFWNAFFGDLVATTGLMNQQAHERNAARIEESCMRWCYYESNLLGDPAQMLFGVSTSVTLDREAYRSDAAARVDVSWPMADETQQVVTVTLQVTNALGAVMGSTNLVCSRVGALGGPGRFTGGPVALAPLGAVNAYFLSALWPLPTNTTNVFADGAPIDDVAPVISNLRVQDITDTSLTVAWDTDEPTFGGAAVGSMLPPGPLWREQMHTTVTTNHTETFNGLDYFTRYFVRAWAEDLAGNRTNAPSAFGSGVTNDYTWASTSGRETLVRYDFERSDVGWAASNINGQVCWEYGQPTTYGPLDASRCWGTILNGRYPSGVNASLTSPIFNVRGSPVIQFRQWTDIQYSMDYPGVTPTPVPFGDYGQIEVLSHGVWQNVTMYADVSAGNILITGTSDGWQSVRVELPASFADQALSLRFRFVSDEQTFEDGNQAGWYVDDIAVSDVPNSGLGISGCDLADSGAGLVGDGDGMPEAGETVALRLRLYNYGNTAIMGVSGSLVLLTSGGPAESAELVDGSPAAVTYGTVNPAQETAALQAVRVRLAPGIMPGTVVTVLQTLTDSLGRRYETRYDLIVGQYMNISGTVVEVGSLTPIADALVTAVCGSQTLATLTALNGTFTVNGAVSNGFYLVTASKPGFYSSSNVVVQAPASGVTIALGKSAALIAPTSLALAAPVTGMDSGVVVVSNAVTATAALHVTVTGITYLDGDGWLDVTPTEFLLAPGGSRDLTLTASAATLPAGLYRAQVQLQTDDPVAPALTIDVTFTVTADPWLTYGGFMIEDDTDGDRRLESGETGDMWIYLGNTNGMSPALNVQGTLTPLDPRVTLTNPPGAIVWSYIPAFGSRLSDNGVGLQFAPGIPEGEHLWFRLDVTHVAGSNTFYFELVHGQYLTVTGQVQCLWMPPPGTPTPILGVVTGAVVTAETTNGLVFTSQPTDTNGMYSISGVPYGNTWFRVLPPTVYPYVPPAGRNELVDTEPEVVNFMVTEYGTNAPHLRLQDVIVDDTFFGDGDGAIDPGETLVVRNFIWNDGLVSALGVTGVLACADMGLGVGPFMTVDDGLAEAPVTILPSATTNLMVALQGGFIVTVSPTAQVGDMQRFWLTAADSANPVRAWPFDFALTVNPRFSIRGTITFANPADNTPANMGQVRVVADYPGGPLTTIPAADGTYAIAGIPAGVRVVVSVRVPSGFGAAPPSVVFDPIAADVTGVDFTLTEVAFAVLPTSLDVTIHEGRTATNTLTVVNGSSSNLTVQLSASYARGPYDVVTPDGALATLLAESPTDWATLGDDTHVVGELEIRFKDGTGWEARQAFLARHGLKALFHFRHIPACVAVPLVAATALNVAPMAQAISADPDVLYMQPAAKVNPSAVPNDPLFGELYGLRNVRQTGGTLGADIGTEKAWNVTTGSEDVVVAVCDTGVEWTHDDLLANTWENTLDKPGDVNGDGMPGAAGVDDDADAERQLYYRNPVTGALQGPEIPGNEIDDDGDGIYDETGIDLRDEDVMTADYDRDGLPTCRQQMVTVWDPIGLRYVTSLQETWDPEDAVLAASDDDENGYADDIHGWCFFDWDSDVLNHDLRSGHGTHVAGTIGAVANNGIGVAGVNWRVKIMPLSLTSRAKRVQFTTPARIAKAIEYALDQGVHVSNHSWGGGAASGILYETMKIAEVGYKHLFIVSAGNRANNVDKTKIYPAYYSTILNNVITVAATDHDDQMAPFSNWGEDSVQIAAPGVDILSTLPAALVPRVEGDGVVPLAGAYGYMSGTSMAAPHVAGAAALLWSVAPDATYEAVKKALLVGSRHDDSLVGWVKSAGHLDVSSALAALGRDWIAFETNLLTVAAGGSETVDVYLNPGRNLKSGDYLADITASCELGTRIVPVALHVLEQPLATITDVRIVADTDGDGFAEPGETVDFFVTLHNTGSGTFAGLQGLLSPITVGAGVPVNTAAWDYIYSGLSGESLTAYRVTLPAGSYTQAAFDLLLTAIGADPQHVRLTLPTVRHYQITGRVVNTSGAGVSGATVEFWGASAGRTTTAGDGSYIVNGLLNGVYTLRAIPTAHARSAQANATVAGANVAQPNLVVTAPAVSFSTNLLAVTVQQGMTGAASLTIANPAANAFVFRGETMPATKVGLFADGQSLQVLQAPLRQMGFQVDWYSNNFATVHVVDKASGLEYIVQQVRHTWDDEKVFQYPFVIADISGSNGTGRVFSDAEADVFTRYLARGGRVLFTGVNPLTIPDNELLAPLVGVAVTNRDDAIASTAIAAQDWMGRFVQILTGQRLAVTPQIYDLATAAGATVLFTAGDGNKLLRYVTAEGGEAYLWTGNPSDADWALEGAGRDLLRDILRQSFLQDAALQTDLTWLHATGTSGSVASGSTTISLTFNADRLAEPGTYRGVLAVLGNYVGEEIAAVPVEFTVAPATLRVFTSGQVTDWRGVPLLGNGDPDSSLYQVIYAGADGVPQAPSVIDGAPTGDDTLLATFIEGEAFGRFGAGVTADAGKFDKLFSHGFPPGAPGRKVFVRAWDGASFDASLAYGDSTVKHTVTYVPWEQADFGSWQVTNVVNYTRDSNGDSIPDGWIMKFRPDLDPRAPQGPLPSTYTYLSRQTIQKDTGNPTPLPYRVVVSKPSGKYVYALDYANNRIVTVQTNLPTAKVFYGSTGSGNGLFSSPEGMAADPRPGEYRLAVADTQNHRIQLFTYNPTSGAITFERKFGTSGTGVGNLQRPTSVAIDGSGRIFVADTLNNRIAIFRVSDGAWLGSFTGSGSYVLSAPQGLVVDDDLDGGVWVCDTANNRITLYSSSGVFKRSFGSRGTTSGKFESPVDVQLWRMGTAKRLVVVDKTNCRVQLFTVNGVHLLNVGTPGALAGQLSLPNGCDPLDGEPVICVADTFNARIEWFRLALDADADGMSDFWEDIHTCLSSAIYDADADPDNDGVSNLGESIIGTNPCNPDTNGNGGSDGWELINGRDPLKPGDPVYPPHVTSLTAVPTVSSAGGLVTVILVYDKPVALTSPVTLELSGGATFSGLMNRVSPTTYSLAYTILPADLGAVNAAVSGGYATNTPSYTQDPPVYHASAIFTVTPASSAAIDSITATPATASAGGIVAVTVTFTDPVTDGTPKLALSGAASLPPTPMTKINTTTYSYPYTVDGNDASGFVAATVSGATDAVTSAAVPPGTNPLAFSVFFPPFSITAIGGNPMVMSWTAVTGAKYLVQTNGTLAVSGWGTLATVTATGNPMNYTITPSLPHLFFRVKRVNP
jgi:subtilisin family serine protease